MWQLYKTGGVEERTVTAVSPAVLKTKTGAEKKGKISDKEPLMNSWIALCWTFWRLQPDIKRTDVRRVLISLSESEEESK